MKLVIPPQVLVRGGGVTPDKQQFLCYNSDTAAASPSAATDGADCSMWTQIAVVCRKAAATHSYATRLWWYYAAAGLWVEDTSVAQNVTDAAAVAFVVNTGAASRVYVEVTLTGAAAAFVSAEANR